MRLKWFTAALMCAALMGSARFCAAEEQVYKIVIKGHKFMPEGLIIPANKKVRISIENKDPTAEEFESYDLNREKGVAANGKITLFVGPLKPGAYKYFGDFHPQTAQGRICAEEKVQ